MLDIETLDAKQIKYLFEKGRLPKPEELEEEARLEKEKAEKERQEAKAEAEADRAKAEQEDGEVRVNIQSKQDGTETDAIPTSPSEPNSNEEDNKKE